MEIIVLTCLQSQLIINRIHSHAIVPVPIKQELILQVKGHSPKECKYDNGTKGSIQFDA
jgi:hypothetical protein